MRVRILGSFEVEGVPTRDLGSRKGRTLLTGLPDGVAQHGRSPSKSALARPRR